MILERVISGGQTGADQAGLRAAKRAGIPTGGWMPRGFFTEDGSRPGFAGLYGMKAIDGGGYSARTRMNAKCADVTLWFGDPETPGGVLTRKSCVNSLLMVIWNTHAVYDRPPERTAEWLASPMRKCRILNVSGNRESRNPGIGAWVESYLGEVFRILKEGTS